jgi:hypothetical protein
LLQKDSRLAAFQSAWGIRTRNMPKFADKFAFRSELADNFTCRFIQVIEIKRISPKILIGRSLADKISIALQTILPSPTVSGNDAA